MSTTWEPIESLSDLLNGNNVKVVVGDNGYPLYFSRSPVPWPREAALRHEGDPNKAIEEEPDLLKNYKKHTGLYVYRREYLLKFTKLPQTRLEHYEMLEQLRSFGKRRTHQGCESGREFDRRRYAGGSRAPQELVEAVQAAN